MEAPTEVTRQLGRSGYAVLPRRLNEAVLAVARTELESLLPRDRDVMLTAIWALDDFTAENGATLVVPGSHEQGQGKPAREEAVPMEMPAGSVML
jgi:hypothetical protein